MLIPMIQATKSSAIVVCSLTVHMCYPHNCIVRDCASALVLLRSLLRRCDEPPLIQCLGCFETALALSCANSMIESRQTLKGRSEHRNTTMFKTPCKFGQMCYRYKQNECSYSHDNMLAHFSKPTHSQANPTEEQDQDIEAWMEKAQQREEEIQQHEEFEEWVRLQELKASHQQEAGPDPEDLEAWASLPESSAPAPAIPGSQQHPAPPRNSTSGASVAEPSLVTQLESAQPDQRLDMLGECLFPMVEESLFARFGYTAIAPKITGMLLELETAELMILLAEKPALEAKISGALQVLDVLVSSFPQA